MATFDHSKTRFLFPILLILSIAFRGHTQSLPSSGTSFNPEMGNFFINNYSRSFMNAAAGNWCLLQDRDGVMYIGNTADGVFIYDGQRLNRVLDKERKPKIGLAREMVMDSHNTIYTSIGPLEFGVIEKNEYGESIYTTLSSQLKGKDELKSVVWGIAIRNDTIFIQSEHIIYLYKDKKLLRSYSFNDITHVMSDPGDGVYVRVWGKGLYKYAHGEFELLPATSAVFANNRIDAMYLLPSGEHLLISRNVGAWLMKKDQTLQKLAAPLLDEYAIQGESYMGTGMVRNKVIPMTTAYRGLALFDLNYQLNSVFNEKNGLTDQHVSYYILDRAGDIWGATTSHVFKVSFDTSLTYFSEVNGINGSVENIRRIGDKLWIRTNNDLYYLDPRKSVQDNSRFVAAGVNELGLAFIPFGNQIVSTNNYTIKATSNGKVQTVSSIYRSRNSIQSKLNPSLLFTSNTAYGLLIHQYSNGQWKQLVFPAQDTVMCTRVEEIEPGELILTSRNGLFGYSYDQTGRGKYFRYERDVKKTTKDLFAVLKINDKEMLVHDTLLNVYKIDRVNKKLKYTGFSFLPYVDRYNFGYHYNPSSQNGWMISTTGLFKVHYDQENGFHFEKYPFYKVDLNELSMSIFAEGAGEEEVLWIGSQDQKIYRYLPEKARKDVQKNYSALIRSISSNGQKLPLYLQKIPYANNNLIFEVAYPVYGNEQKTKFSYWLEGQDKQWGQFTYDSKKEYTNLMEGKYTLHVKAMDASQQISQETILSFSVAPPWYRSVFAYIFYLTGLVFSFFRFGKYQAKRSLKKAEEERKSSELAAAKELQNRLLPKKFPQIAGLDISGYLRTSTEVGGDYYDFFEQKDGSLYAVCGDATGHGTPAGMLVSITKAGIIGLPALPPNEMLKQLNRVVKKVDLGILRMSLNIAYLKGEELTLSSAGMPPYFIYRREQNMTEEIMLSGVPLGSFISVEYDQIKTTFKSGDVVVIISDGLPEAPNPSGSLFDYDRVSNLITQNADLTASLLIETLIKEADSWLSGLHNPDDITIIVIKKS